MSVLPVFIVEQNLVEISPVMLVMFCCHLGIYTTHHKGHYVKTRRHPQNRKYITYRNAVGGGPSHGHRQHAKIRPRGLRVMRAGRQTHVLITITGTPPPRSDKLLYDQTRFRLQLWLALLVCLSCRAPCNHLETRLQPPGTLRLTLQ